MTTGHYIRLVRRKIHKEDILIAGKELIHEFGFNAVSIKDITEKVEIPKGSFYNHFQSKNDFLVEVVNTYASESFDLIQKHLLNSPLSPIQRLQNYFEAAIEFYGSDVERLNGCLIGNICQELANVNPELRVLLEHNLSGANDIIANIINEGIELGEINYPMDVYELVNFITNSWQGALLRMKATGNNAPLYAFQNLLFNRILSK